MARKYDSIDLVKLISGKHEQFYDDYQPTALEDGVQFIAKRSKAMLTSHDKWNMWLTECLNKNDLETLIKYRYGLQAGMADAVSAGLSSPMMAEMYTRWLGSIERTARKIVEKRNPLPKVDKNADLEMYRKVQAAKRQRRSDFERFLLRSSF